MLTKIVLGYQLIFLASNKQCLLVIFLLFTPNTFFEWWASQTRSLLIIIIIITVIILMIKWPTLSWQWTVKGDECLPETHYSGDVLSRTELIGVKMKWIVIFAYVWNAWPMVEATKLKSICEAWRIRSVYKWLLLILNRMGISWLLNHNNLWYTS